MLIEVEDYDPAWPGIARHAIAELTTATAGWLTVVEHIGSTSVPGLAAKPVIDLMASATTLGVPAPAAGALRALGYRRLDTPMPERLWFRREAGPTPDRYPDQAGGVAYHLHVVLAPSWATRNERLLRDHLLEHAADREAYAALKRELSAAGHGGDAYTRAKTALIQRMVDAARAARGLPAVDVWEE